MIVTLGGRIKQFSTEEQDTGIKWLEEDGGGEIYQRSYIFTPSELISSGSNTYYFEVGTPVERVIDYNLIAVRENGKVNVPRYGDSSWIQQPEDLYSYKYSKLQNTMRWTIGTSIIKAKIFYFTLWYIKHEE